MSEHNLSLSHELIASKPVIKMLGLGIILGILFMLAFLKISYAGVCENFYLDPNPVSYPQLRYALIKLKEIYGGEVVRWNPNDPDDPENVHPRKIYYMIYNNTDNPNDSNNPPNYLDPDFIETAIRNAFQTWQSELGNLIAFEFDRNYSPAKQDEKGYITIMWDPSLKAPGCCTIKLKNETSRYIDSAKIYLNKNYQWGDTYNDGGVYDLQGSITHEIGHALGLGDLKVNYNKFLSSIKKAYQSCKKVQTMEGGWGICFWCMISSFSKQDECISKELRDLGDGDKAGIKVIYPPDGHTPPAPPEVVEVEYPPNGEPDIDPTNLTLRWNPGNYTADDNIVYWVSLYEDGNCEGPADDHSMFYPDDGKTCFWPKTSLQTNKLNYNRTYWWAVWAKDGHGNWSPSPEPWFSFTTKSSTPSNQSPDQPSLIHPVGGESVEGQGVGFSWAGGDPDGDPLRYRLIIRQYSQEGPTVYNDYVSYGYDNTTSFTYTLANSSIYYWTVWVEDPEGLPSHMACWGYFLTRPEPVYSASLYQQSPAKAISLQPGDSFNLGISYTNTGNLNWSNNEADSGYVELRSCNFSGLEVPSYLYPGDGIWLRDDQIRVASTTQANLAPDQNATFSFTGKVPDSALPGYVNVYFRLWHKTGGYIGQVMHFTIQVAEGAAIYSASFNRQSPSASLTLAPGDVYSYVVSYLNTGTRDWKNDPSNDHYVELHSCDSSGNPVPSYLYPGDGLWVSDDQIRVISQNAANVAPEENAWFIFSGKVPDTASAGVVEVYFRMWHKSGGNIGGVMHFSFNIDPDLPVSESPVVILEQPKGGEILSAGVAYEIKWTASDDVSVTSVDIYLSISGDDNYGVILYGNLPNTESKIWNLPNQNMLCKLKVVAYDGDGNSGFDTSYAPFQISTYSPDLSAPNLFGLGLRTVGQDYTIYWCMVLNALNYTLQEDISPSFLTPQEYQINDYFYAFTGKADGTYYYRVRANNSGNSSNWSNTYQLLVNEAGTIAGAEYFIDDDPGEGAGSLILIPEDGAYVLLVYPIHCIIFPS